MAVPKQISIRRIQQQREFFKKDKKEEIKEDVSEEEHQDRLNKLKDLGLIK